MADRHRSQTFRAEGYDYPYGTEPDASLITPVEEAGNYVNSIDKALYLSYEAYAQAASERISLLCDADYATRNGK